MRNPDRQNEQRAFDARQVRAYPRTSADGRVTYGMGAPAHSWQAGARPTPGSQGFGQPGTVPNLAVQQMYAQQAAYARAAAQQPKRRRRVGVWVAVAVALICIAVAVLLAFTMCDGDAGSRRAGAPGQLENKTPAEIQAELDRYVEEGMFNISIASVVQFADGASEGELRIENVPGNRYLMAVEITLGDTGQTVYESGVIEPDHHIQRDSLSVVLPKGSYDATATFTALDPQTEEEVGNAAAKIILQVLT